MIKQEQGTFRSVAGEMLDKRLWLPEGEVRGVVQLVHGMAEHIVRYDGAATAMAEAGYAVVGHTHLGHGAHARLQGHFGREHGWQNLVDDVHRLRAETERRFSGVPYFLLGHSMGSFVVRCYLTRYAEGLAGAIISGTGYYAPAVVKAGLALANVQCAFGQAEKPSALINKVAFSSSNKPFAPNRTPFDWLTRVDEEVDRYVADPYCGFLFTAAGYRDMFRGLNQLNDLQALKKIPKGLPVLFFSGDHDPVGNMGVGVNRVADQFRDAGVKQVTVRLYTDGRHEMFNEINREEVYRDVIAWLRQHE